MSKIVGSAYKELKSLIASYVKANHPVLLLGDTGAGKELFAKHFMELSKGKKIREGAQRTVSCATFSDSLLSDEIFGHEKGAFTGAESKRLGLLRTCNKGILFLDELDKASKEFQHAILRVSEGYSFRQTGSDNEITDNDTLIIAAASRLSDIEDQLVNRFHVLAVPPLQEFDIPDLAEHFLGKPIKDEVYAQLGYRKYPGNVRELKKLCERLAIERGTTLFSGSKRRRLLEDHPFDYKRFSEEFLHWHEYLSPIIDQFHLDIRYEYQQGSVDHALPSLNDTISLMISLRYGSKEIGVVEAFDRALHSHIKNLELPILLNAIYTKCKAPMPARGSANITLSMLVMQGHGHQGIHADELPAKENDEQPSQLQELFRLPFGEARKKFSKMYLENIFHKYGHDLTRAASMTMLTIKGLKSAMKRYGIKKHTIEKPQNESPLI